MTRYTNLDGRRSLAKKLVDSDSEPETTVAEPEISIPATEPEAGPSTSPSKKKKAKAAATKTEETASTTAEQEPQDAPEDVSEETAETAAQPATDAVKETPQEPMTVEKLLKRAKLLKLKAKKAKTDEARKKFQKQTRDIERQVEQLHGAFEYGPKGQLIKKGDAQSENQWQSRQKQDWNGPSTYGGDSGWSSRGGSGFGAGGEGYGHSDERWKMERRDERREERAMDRQKKLKCFACRGMGHSAKDCPNTLDAQSISLKSASSVDTPMMGRDAVGICFRCGSTEHTLSRCKKAALPGDELPFATCFVCGAKGHLSSKCPNNAGKGVYPEGGSCKVCNSVQHLARDCPIVLRREGTSASATGTNSIVVGSARDSTAGGDEDEFHAQARKRANATDAAPDTPLKKAKRTKVISF